MNTLNNLKARYQKAKTQATKTKIFNLAALNLSHADFQEFVKWQTNL